MKKLKRDKTLPTEKQIKRWLLEKNELEANYVIDSITNYGIDILGEGDQDIHKDILKQIDKDLDKLKKSNQADYEISETHLSVVAREIHARTPAKKKFLEHF